MNYPVDMTADDIMSFEYDYNRLLDMEYNEGYYWIENTQCQLAINEELDSRIDSSPLSYFGIVEHP